MSVFFTAAVCVYNTEKYLRECLDSVLNQSYKNFELLIIDDGSTDKSGCICDEYAEKDSRVRVIHTENQGVLLARKTAFENARLGTISSSLIRTTPSRPSCFRD